MPSDDASSFSALSSCSLFRDVLRLLEDDLQLGILLGLALGAPLDLLLQPGDALLGLLHRRLRVVPLLRLGLHLPLELLHCPLLVLDVLLHLNLLSLVRGVRLLRLDDLLVDGVVVLLLIDHPVLDLSHP